MFSTIALIIIAIATCFLAITYYCEREDLVRQLRDIDYSLSEMRTSLNKLEHINNKMLAIENKVQTSIDRITSIKTYIENDVTMHLSGIKAGQDIQNSKINSSITKLQHSVNIIEYCTDTTKTNTEIIKESNTKILDGINKLNIKRQASNKAKNSSNNVKPTNTIKTNKESDTKLKTAN